MNDGNPEYTPDTEEENSKITRVIDANRGQTPFHRLETKSGNTDAGCKVSVPPAEGDEDEERVFLP